MLGGKPRESDGVGGGLMSGSMCVALAVRHSVSAALLLAASAS